MTMNPGYQISLDVQGHSCLVIGGEEEAVEKIERLLDAGAKITVLNPTLHSALRKLTASGKIVHRGRTFRTTDVQSGVILVLNTLRHDPDLPKLLFDLAKTERFLVWSVDQPEFSTIMMPAVVRRGHLRVAIGTSGASPALAKALRQDLENIFDDEFVDCLNWLGGVREELQKEEWSEIKRRERLQQIVEGFRLAGKIEFPKSWVEKKEASQNDG